MMPAAKAFDPVLGVDIHIVQPPGPVPPIPVPHPFVGILFDPMEFVPVIGATVMVNGVPRAIAGTAGKAVPPHIPIGGMFVKPPANECEMFMGSATVAMDGDAASYMALPVLSCQDIGMPPPPRVNPKKKSKVKSLVLPTSVVLPIPMGAPVLIGGPPTISLMALGMRLGFAGLGRLARSRMMRRLMRRFQRFRRNACRNMRPGFIKCILLRAEPVHIITGEVVVEQQDFALPWRIPVGWTRRYRTHATRTGVCGRGWETPADARLELDDDGTVAFFDGTPGASFFESLPDGGPVTELVAGATLDRVENGLAVRTRDGLAYHFRAPAEGQRELPLEYVADRCGNWLQFVRVGGALAEIRDSSGQRIEVRSRAGRVESMVLVDPDTGEKHPLVRYAYGAGGVLDAVYDALDVPYRFGYDAAYRLERHTDRNGLSFHYAFDTPLPDARVVHAWGDGGLYDYRFEYEPAVGRTRITDSLGHTSVVEYDEDGLPYRETDPLGGVTQWQYDEAGRCSAQTDPAGHLTEWAYDARGNLVKETRADGSVFAYEYDEESRPSAFTDPNGARWGQVWDARGLLRKRTTPRGGAWQFEYTEAGDLAALTDPLHHTSRFVTDRLGRVREVIDPLRHATRMEVDAFGNTVARTDPAGHRTTYEYDAKGRLIATVDPAGGRIDCRYDAEDRPAWLRNEVGAVTELRYFGLGELGERLNADGTRVRYAYDTEERLVAVTNERGQRYRLNRDPLGRTARTVDYWGNTTDYHYAGSGALARSVDALNRVTAYTFDAVGRLTRVAYVGGAADEYAFDPAGNLVRAENAAAAVERKYDEEGNLVEERQGDFAVASTYDLLGRRVARASSLGHTVRFAYDARGLPTGVDLDDAPLARTKYDARGLPVAEALHGGLQRTFEWDRAGRMTAQRLLRGGGPVTERRYAYDTAGQLVERGNLRGDRERYTYDPLGRIAAQLDPAGQLARFAYDPAGDLLADVTPAPAGDGAPSGRVARKHGTTYQFDRAGNLVHRVSDRGEARFRWDGANRLAEAVTETGETVTFRYDALGRRVEKVSGERVTRFVWDADVLLADEADPSHPREFVFRPATFEVLASVNGQVCHYENDQVGLPHEVVDERGNVLWSAEYGAFGETIRVNADGFDNPVRFQGQYHDTETGLSYNRFRYYDSSIGGFISADPLRLAAGPNLYRYALNAWGWIDPLGLMCAMGAGRRMTPDQIALKNLVEETTLGGRRPLTAADANTVLDLAHQVRYPGVRASAADLATPSNWTANPVPHIHFPGVGSGHIPVIMPGVIPR
jgi:RHS repeat-associated protein